MSTEHRAFRSERLVNSGVPVFSAPLVSCLLPGTCGGLHAAIMAVGPGLIRFGHNALHHKRRGTHRERENGEAEDE